MVGPRHCPGALTRCRPAWSSTRRGTPPERALETDAREERDPASKPRSLPPLSSSSLASLSSSSSLSSANEARPDRRGFRARRGGPVPAAARPGPCRGELYDRLDALPHLLHRRLLYPPCTWPRPPFGTRARRRSRPHAPRATRNRKMSSRSSGEDSSRPHPVKRHCTGIMRSTVTVRRQLPKSQFVCVTLSNLSCTRAPYVSTNFFTSAKCRTSRHVERGHHRRW